MSEETKAPAAAKEEAPKPVDPRETAAQAVLDTIKGRIVAQFGEAVLEAAQLAKYLPTLLIKNEHFREVATFLKTEPTLAFTYPEMMAGTDYKEYMEVVALLHSFELDKDVLIKVRTPRENPTVQSLVPLFGGFNWEEREIFDLLGIRFEGHPDLRKIMLSDDWQGHPLRKDYVVMD